jgi:hypothetical protein
VEAGVAVHTAARRYCLKRYAQWSEIYAEIVHRGRDRERGGYHYTPEALGTFPRYNVLEAIRVELERIDPVELGDFEATKARAIRAGQTANDDFTRNPIGSIERKAIADERAAFCGYIAGLSHADLRTVEPLPYRRVLAADESESVWGRLREHWQMPGGYWYPLADCMPLDVAAFDVDAFNEGAPPDRLQAILKRRGLVRVWELREYGPEYEQDVSLFDPHYNGAEGYWSSGALDWIVYASHESTITVGGWLLEEVKALWPSWQAHLWRGAL